MRSPFSDLPREIAVLSGVAFSVALGFGVVAPAIPLFARQFGVGLTAAGAVVSAFALMRLVSALGGGRLVDRLGERVVLATGIGIVAVSSLLAGLAQTYLQLLVLRGIGGVGSAMFTVSAVSLVLRVAPPDQRGGATGLYQGGFLVGGIAGPALGGVVTAGSARVPFFVYAGTLAVAGAIGLAFLAHTPLAEREHAQRASSGVSLRDALRTRPYRSALTVNFGTGWALFGVRSSLLPLFVVESLHRSAVWVGVGLVASSIGQALLLLPAGRLADRVGRRPAMLLGGTLTATATLVLALVPQVAAYVAALVLLGVGSAFLGVAPAAVVGDVARGRSGTVVAAFGMASDFGAVIGPIAAGLIVDASSYAVAWLVTAAILGVGVLMTATMPETRHVAAPTPVLEPEGEQLAEG